MNWLQKIANDVDKLWNGDDVWSYDDYKTLMPRLEHEKDYQSIGHTSPNVSIWKIDSKFQFHESSDLEATPYKDRHHGLLDDPNVSIHEQDSIAHGRVDMDSMQGSINMVDGNLDISSVPGQMKIFDILISRYPGVKFFVWAGISGSGKIPLQQYIEQLG